MTLPSMTVGSMRETFPRTVPWCVSTSAGRPRIRSRACASGTFNWALSFLGLVILATIVLGETDWPGSILSLTWARTPAVPARTCSESTWFFLSRYRDSALRTVASISASCDGIVSVRNISRHSWLISRTFFLCSTRALESVICCSEIRSFSYSFWSTSAWSTASS